MDHLRECVGRWELSGVIAEGTIRCSVCGATFPATASNTTAAFEGNYLGSRLRELAEEGARLLHLRRGSRHE